MSSPRRRRLTPRRLDAATPHHNPQKQSDGCQSTFLQLGPHHFRPREPYRLAEEQVLRDLNRPNTKTYFNGCRRATFLPRFSGGDFNPDVILLEKDTKTIELRRMTDRSRMATRKRAFYTSMLISLFFVGASAEGIIFRSVEQQRCLGIDARLGGSVVLDWACPLVTSFDPVSIRFFSWEVKTLTTPPQPPQFQFWSLGHDYSGTTGLKLAVCSQENCDGCAHYPHTITGQPSFKPWANCSTGTAFPYNYQAISRNLSDSSVCWKVLDVSPSRPVETAHLAPCDPIFSGLCLALTASFDPGALSNGRNETLAFLRPCAQDLGWEIMTADGRGVLKPVQSSTSPPSATPGLSPR
jgi:hypothetical protein